MSDDIAGQAEAALRSAIGHLQKHQIRAAVVKDRKALCDVLEDMSDLTEFVRSIIDEHFET